MAMSKTTMEAINAIIDNKGATKTRQEWYGLLNGKITFETFKKYVLTEVLEYEEVALEDVIELLNDCAGEDCYECRWHYVVRDGKVFKENVKYIWNRG